MKRKAKTARQGMSIGALSRATGVPAATLRTWERRYGFPAPDRTDSGHRRFGLHTLARLRLVARAIELGHRPSTVLSADDSALAQLVEALEPVDALPVAAAGADMKARGQRPTRPEHARRAPLQQRQRQARIDGWLAHVEQFDGAGLERALAAAAAELGSLAFMEQLLSPFLHELGERWAQGALGVRHEHFAAERVREFLAQRWRALSDAAAGPLLCCATLPGERHVLGLHMAALALALHDARILFLGADAPTPEIAGAVRQHRAAAVLLSAAAGADQRAVEQHVAILHDGLPANVPIVTGGEGFPQGLAGALRVESLSDLVAWLKRRRAQPVA